MKITYNITAFNTGGASVPKISNIQLDENGILSFDLPDLTKIEKYSPIVNYLINVNDNVFETSKNENFVGNYLINGINNINIKVKILLTDEDGQNQNIQYEITYTPVNYFTLEEFSDELNGEGYSIINYTGSFENINIPEFADDGKKILNINFQKIRQNNPSINIKKINGNFITNTTNGTLTTVTSIYLPSLNSDHLVSAFQQFENLEEININCKIATTLYQTFSNCKKLVKIIINPEKVTSLRFCFSGCESLKEAPNMYTGKVTDMLGTFSNCILLENIPGYDLSNVNTLERAFQYCYSLKTFLAYGMKVSFDISSSTKFEREDLVTILNNLGTVSETQTLTMGSTNLAKLTSEDKAIATNKGWVLA